MIFPSSYDSLTDVPYEVCKKFETAVKFQISVQGFPLHQLLKSYDVSITVLGTSKVSGSLVFPILETIKTCVLKEDSDDPTFIQEMKRKMKTDLSDRIAKYVNTTVLRNASALDPREKKLKFMPSKATRKVVQDRILAEMKSVRLSELDPVPLWDHVPG